MWNRFIIWKYFSGNSAPKNGAIFSAGKRCRDRLTDNYFPTASRINLARSPFCFFKSGELSDPASFRYYSNQGIELVPPGGATLPPSSLIRIDAVDINIKVNTPNQFKSGPTTIYTRVGLPNSGTGVLVTPAATP